jgi:hypothetical protein
MTQSEGREPFEKADPVTELARAVALAGFGILVHLVVLWYLSGCGFSEAKS